MKSTTRIIAILTVILLTLPTTMGHAQNRARLADENLTLKRQIDSLNSMLDNLKRKSREDEKTIAEITEAHRKATERGNYVPFNLGENAKDSISLWDAQDRIRRYKEENYNLDSVKLESKISDDIYMERLKEMNNIFALPYNDIVRNNVILYAERRKSSMPTMLGLCSYYFPIFQETFNKYGIPEELACMAIIESAMNPLALSRAGARGMWQFMYATAKVYGLRIDSYVDERLDVHKAADAAARYLLDAYQRFGDWSLAISSYNCGSGNVKRAITRAGGKTGYWDIYPYLPKETRGYVPAFVGALYITKYYKEHGINPKPCALPEKVDTFLIHKKLHFTQIHDVIGVPVGELRNLNPQYVHDIVPGNDMEYVLRIPEHYVEAFMEHEDSIYRYKADSLFNPLVIKKIETGSAANTSQGTRTTYKVKSGDTLSKIASKYHVSINDLKRWNNLKSTNIRVGQNLYVYNPASATKVTTTVTQSQNDKPAASTTKAPAETEKKASSTTETSNTETAEAKNVETPATVADTTAAAKPELEEEEEEEIREITRHPGLEGTPAQPQTKVEETVQEESDPKEEAPKYTEYKVRQGDTLFGIAKKFEGVSAMEIMEFNGVDANIHPGDILKIPVKD
ncbi:MAG: LysM peptidoglycan-binding domain-containing protein [Bacteroidales bacterium]|nr:LysM peptidoglycan-binding domain-containing protein [Bacteroidales bacterium]